VAQASYDEVFIGLFENPVVGAKFRKHRLAVFSALEPRLHIRHCIGYDHHRHLAAAAAAGTKAERRSSPDSIDC
jgi:hypothetical protein